MVTIEFGCWPNSLKQVEERLSTIQGPATVTNDGGLEIPARGRVAHIRYHLVEELGYHVEEVKEIAHGRYRVTFTNSLDHLDSVWEQQFLDNPDYARARMALRTSLAELKRDFPNAAIHKDYREDHDSQRATGYQP